MSRIIAQVNKGVTEDAAVLRYLDACAAFNARLSLPYVPEVDNRVISEMTAADNALEQYDGYHNCRAWSVKTVKDLNCACGAKLVKKGRKTFCSQCDWPQLSKLNEGGR